MPPDGTMGLTLSYGSFAALNTYMIQEHDILIQNLERRLNALEAAQNGGKPNERDQSPS